MTVLTDSHKIEEIPYTLILAPEDGTLFVPFAKCATPTNKSWGNNQTKQKILGFVFVCPSPVYNTCNSFKYRQN